MTGSGYESFGLHKDPITCKPYIPFDASVKEKNIHAYLSLMDIYTVDLK